VHHSKTDAATSHLGQGQTFNSVRVTSALPLITDSEQTLRHVGYGPQRDICSAAKSVVNSRVVQKRLATPHSALAKDVVMVAGSASRISMSWIWAIASASATLGARPNEIVIVGSSLTPEAVAFWLSTSAVA